MNIVVCTTPRSGSNWFRDELVLRGYPECSEWFHPGQPIYSDQLIPRIKQARLENKDFGVKLFPEHVQKNGDSIYDLLEMIDNEPNIYIRLLRSNLREQAMSWSGSRRQQSWFESTQKYSSNNEKEVVNFRDRIHADNKWWDRRLRDKDYFLVRYEEMKEDIDYTMFKVVQYIESRRS